MKFSMIKYFSLVNVLAYNICVKKKKYKIFKRIYFLIKNIYTIFYKIFVVHYSFCYLYFDKSMNFYEFIFNKICVKVYC